MPRGVFQRAGDGHHGAPYAPDYEIVPAGDTWRNKAACRDHETLLPQAWDDVTCDDNGRRETGRQRAMRVAAAKTVCDTECPVKHACLAAVDLRWDEGVRGGIDLRNLRRPKRRPA